MKHKNWLEEKLAKYENDLDFITEEKIIEFNEKIVSQMRDKNISRAELASKMGVTKAFITRILNGSPNLTIKTMTHIALCLNCNIHIDVCSKLLRPNNSYVFADKNYRHFQPVTEGFDYASVA